MRGREALRGVLQEGRITMHPVSDGAYVAEFGFLALTAVGGSGQIPSAVTSMKVNVPKPADRRLKR